MITKCSRCGEDFLTEADMHIVTPVKNYDLTCMCVTRELEAQLSQSQEKIKELEKSISCNDEMAKMVIAKNDYIVELERKLKQQQFNNEHNLSIDQKVADRIKELEGKLEVAVKALKFYKDNNNIRATEDKYLNHVALKALASIAPTEEDKGEG